MRRLVLALLASLALVGCGGDGEQADTGDGPDLHSGPPPWPLKSPQSDYIDRAGLPKLSSEGDVVHFHAHLDVIVDGEAVDVPANVGIDTEKRVISPLHTHADRGILHVEAEDDEDVTLGQFLTQWGVESTATCVTSYCGPNAAVYVDGEKQPTIGDLVIRADTQIALILGTPPAEIPAFYDCAQAAAEASTCQNFKRPT